MLQDTGLCIRNVFHTASQTVFSSSSGLVTDDYDVKLFGAHTQTQVAHNWDSYFQEAFVM